VTRVGGARFRRTVLDVSGSGQKGCLGAGQLSSEIGRVVKPGNQSLFDGRYVELRGSAAFYHHVEHAVVPKVFKRKCAADAVHVEDEVPSGITGHTFRQISRDGVEFLDRGKRVGRPRIARRASANTAQDRVQVVHADQVGNLHAPPQVFDRLAANVLEDRPLAVGPYDASALVDPGTAQREQRLARQVSDGLPGIRAAEDEKADIRVGQDIRDDSLDAQILRVERADN